MYDTITQNKTSVFFNCQFKSLLDWISRRYMRAKAAQFDSKMSLLDKQLHKIVWVNTDLKIKHGFINKTARLPLVSEPCAQLSMSATCVLVGSVASVLWSSREHAQQQQLHQGPLTTTQLRGTDRRTDSCCCRCTVDDSKWLKRGEGGTRSTIKVIHIKG